MQHAGMHFSDHHYICRLQKMKERILKSGNTSHSSNQYTRRPNRTAMVQLTKRKTENSTASDGQHVWWIDYLKEKKSTVNPPLHNISITALQVKEYSILRPYVLSSSWSAVQTTGTETKETYSIMIILLSLSLAPATKKNLSVYEGLVGYLLIYSREQVTNYIWKQRHSYCFLKKTAKIFTVHLLTTDLHFAGFCCCINAFFYIVSLSLSCCHRHALLCQCTRWLLSQIPHPHTLSPHILRHKGSGKRTTCLCTLLP